MDENPRKILVTGGCGYIGSHVVLKLIESGCKIVVVDNLTNSSAKSLDRITQLTGKAIDFVEGDICNREVLNRIFAEHAIEAVMHFAGLKSVGESVSAAVTYYENNLGGTINLVQAMTAAGVFRLVFSSSATVYGTPERVPISESDGVGIPANPYGWSKLMAEQVLQDAAVADPRWSIGLLRYFNPAGAHPSGLIGEDPRGIPNNLVPYVSQVAFGIRPYLPVFGADYPTPDGTGVRDYIHVVDLADGHVAALEYLRRHRGAHIWNLGTGIGYSVMEILGAMERASGKRIPYQLAERRAGDVASCWASAEKATVELGWTAKRGLDDMMVDSWHWQSRNPLGYGHSQKY